MPGTAHEGVRLEEVEGAGRFLRLVLDAGKGNVVTSAVIAELRELFAGAAAAPDVQAVILDHAGEHFSFGASVEEHRPEQVADLLPRLHALAREVVASRVPLLASVRGMCLGGGLELVLLAQRVFAAPGARFGQPEIQLGVFAPIGSAVLPHVVGPGHAADLLLSGRTVDAGEARAMGLVAEVADDPGAAAADWAREHLAGKSAASLRFAVEALGRAEWLRALDRLEPLYLEGLMATRDAREGIAAFLERRAPEWENR